MEKFLGLQRANQKFLAGLDKMLLSDNTSVLVFKKVVYCSFSIIIAYFPLKIDV
jgi:hypothetical protein